MSHNASIVELIDTLQDRYPDDPEVQELTRRLQKNETLRKRYVQGKIKQLRLLKGDHRELCRQLSNLPGTATAAVRSADY